MSSWNCHGIVKVFEHKGIELFGSNRRDAEDNFSKFDLVISLDTCNPVKSSVVKGNVYSQGLRGIVNKYGSGTEHIKIDWKDYGAPLLGEPFWNDLAAIIRKKGRDRIRYNRTYKVLVHCMMGHGRTGTALCILASKCDTESPISDELVPNLRKKYCSKAVESLVQIEYIGKMVGVAQKGGGSKSIPKPNKAYTSKVIRDSDLFNRLESKYDLERDFAIEPPTDLHQGRRVCTMYTHNTDLLNLGYCPGCGEETESHRTERKAGKYDDKKFKQGTTIYSSGIGKAITQEDIDKKKEVKLIKANKENNGGQE